MFCKLNFRKKFRKLGKRKILDLEASLAMKKKSKKNSEHTVYFKFCPKKLFFSQNQPAKISEKNRKTFEIGNSLKSGF